MSLTPVQACGMANSIYNPITPGVFSQTWVIEGVTVGYALINGVATFTFAGSQYFTDWLRNFNAAPTNHPQLGHIHTGMWKGMETVFSTLRPFMLGTIAIAGHSLGAAHAAFLAALCAINDIPVAQVFLFAPPRPGYLKMREILAAHVGQIYAYRNGEDPVTGLAPTLPDEPWCDVADLIPLNQKPEYGIFNPIGFHSCALYLAGIRAMP